MKTYETMREIETVYREAAPKYIEQNKVIEAAEARIKEIKADLGLNPRGRDERIKEQRDKIDAAKSARERIAIEAKKKVAMMQKEAKKRFYADPAALDQNVIRLVESGVMPLDELAHVLGNANDTTRRVVGAMLEKNEDERIRALGIQYNQRGGEDEMAMIENLIGIGNTCIGEAPFSGPEGAAYMYEKFDELTGPLFKAAEGLK